MSTDDEFESPFEPTQGARPHDPAKFEQELKLERARFYDRVGLDVGDVSVTAVSPKALLVSFSTLKLPSQWVPRSQVHAGSPVAPSSTTGARGVLVVTKFLALKLQAYESIPGSGRLLLVAEHRKPLNYDRFPEAGEGAS